MRNRKKNRRWLFAVTIAAVFPALAFHASCIAVMGPGTWGSGMQEVYPDRRQPSERILRYADELSGIPGGGRPASSEADLSPPAGLSGEILHSHRAGDRAVFLTAEGDRRRLYVAEPSKVTEIALPAHRIVTRPRLLRGRILFECWNPWALPATQKLLRYLASWGDKSKRPEASLYAYDSAAREWSFVMPGHTLIPAPDGRRAVLLRSGAMAAGYFSIHLWSADDVEPPAFLSLREAEAGSGRSFRVRWTADSAAVQIIGRSGGFERRKREPHDFNLIYSIDNRTLYDLQGTP